MIFVFQIKEQAERFYKVLYKRLEKYGIPLHMEKSQLLESRHKAAERAAKNGGRLKTYKFLGFTCYWGRSRNGKFWRLKYKSRADRKIAKLKGLRQYLRKNLNAINTREMLKSVTKAVQGWVNYHAISDNQKTVTCFLYECERIIHKWFKRRGGRKYIGWEQLRSLLDEVGFPRAFKTISMFPKPLKG
jgi:RNA-directed DNA polymerase